MTYHPNPKRYDAMVYRNCGMSGRKLPAVSLGLWHNFGDATPMATQRVMLRTAFDLGITHFDLANNYGLPAAKTREAAAILKNRGVFPLIHQPSYSLLNRWVEKDLRDPRLTSALIGASRPEQIIELVAALQNMQFSAAELAAVDQHAVEGGINLWQGPATDLRST